MKRESITKNRDADSGPEHTYIEDSKRRAIGASEAVLTTHRIPTESRPIADSVGGIEQQSTAGTPQPTEPRFSCPEEEADECEWEKAFTNTTDEQIASFAEDIRASIRQNGSTPLDFSKR